MDAFRASGGFHEFELGYVDERRIEGHTKKWRSHTRNIITRTRIHADGVTDINKIRDLDLDS